MNKAFKFIKSYLSNILFIFFICAFSLFIFNNKSDLNGLFDFNFLNLSLLTIFLILSYLIKTKLNQYLYSSKNINMSFIETLNLIINSTAGNLSTPFNLGTGYKFHYLKKKYNLTYSENLSINIYFTIFTNLIYVFFLVIISFSNYLNKDSIFFNLFLFWLFILFAGFLLFSILSKESKVKKLNFLNSYSIRSLNLSFSKIINLLIYTILMITVSVVSHIYLFKLLGLQINTAQIIAFVSISGLANIIKFTPGNFGINESVLIISNLYHGLLGVQVIVVSLIFRFFSWLNILIFYSFLNFQKSYNKKNK